MFIFRYKSTSQDQLNTYNKPHILPPLPLSVNHTFYTPHPPPPPPPAPPPLEMGPKNLI